MQIRYIGPVAELTVAPAGHDGFTVSRLDWVDIDAEVAGKRPSGKPGNEKHDPGAGLLAQGEWVDGEFQPLWELESVKKAQRTRAANEAADSGEKE